MERSVVFVCGHRRVVQLPDVITEETAHNLAMFLSRTLCLRCRHVQRAHIVHQLQESLGLVPIVAPDPRQHALAEQVRVVVTLHFLPEQGHPHYASLLAALRSLIHVRLDAAFWLERRAVLWDSQRLPYVLADLQFEATLKILHPVVPC